MIRVALVRAKYNPFGGAERFVENAVAALQANNVSLTVLTRQWPTNAVGTSHVLLNPAYLTSAGRDRGFARAVCAHVAANQYDLVQSHERLACCDIFRAGDGVHTEWLRQRARVDDQWQRLGIALNPHHRYVLAAEREMFASAKLRAVICNSAMVKADIQRHFDIDEKKLRVILSGVDSAKFHPGLVDEFRHATRQRLNIPNAAPVVLFVGSGFARKGVDAFLRSITTLKDAENAKDIYGVVVGYDKHLTRYRTLADRLGLSNRVTFTGGVDDVRPYYAAANVFVLPTLYDPLPNACLEAMACGLPTITSTGSGAAELITNGVEGFVTDALDVQAIANGIEAAFADADMGARARARVVALSPAAMADAYVALYRELLGLPSTTVLSGIQ